MWQPRVESESSKDWVQSVASLPIAFAQVREDPLIDAQVLEHLGRPARVLMVASGGETAALLSTLPIERLHLVDINEAQLNIARLKLQLLTTADTAERLCLLGHAEMPLASRTREITQRLADLELPADSLGQLETVALHGPDHCGRYEWLFARMRQVLAECSDQMHRLMRLHDPQEQARLVTEGSELGDRIEAAFAETMELSTLVKIFGPEATANRVQPFAKHFLQQTRKILGELAAADNPFLHQIFLGSFIGPIWPWLGCARQGTLPETTFSHATMDMVLQESADQSFDFIHLSNILDWIKPAAAQRVLGNANRCLSPGGLVVIRQLNSKLDIAGTPCGFHWMRELSDQLHRTDRSFFYRSLHVGKKL